MVIRESLQPSVFNIGQSPEAGADFISFVMATGGGRKCRRNTSDSEDCVAHSRPTRLIAKNLNPINEPADLTILG
jgi:hypothetical protein